MFKKTILKNGLRIITAPDPRSKAATILVLAGSGSKYEKKETNGISHLLEHLLFKGTKKRPISIDIAESLDRVGGLYNAFTSEEYTGYFAKVASEHFDLALDVISDIYLNSKLEGEEIKKEKKVVIEEINMYQDHPSSYIQVLWNRLLYGDQPAGRDIAGTKESVAKITRDQLLAYMKRQYTSFNTVVCAAGGIASEKQITGKIKKYFSGIGTEKSFGKAAVIEKQSRPSCLLKEKETDQTHFCLGARGYSLFSPKKYVQEILAAILGGMMSSRLFVKIREELGLAYYIKAVSSSESDTGFLAAQTGVDNGRVGKAIVAVLKEFKKISRQRVSPKELKKAKDNLKGKIALGLETSDEKASFYGVQEIIQNKILTPDEIYAKINKVGARDILKTAQDIFRPEKLNLAIIGPFKDGKKFKKLLKI